MKADIINALSVEQIQKAHAAYTTLACIYEDVCGGPYKAREHREYFGIMDSRENLRRRYLSLNVCDDGE